MISVETTDLCMDSLGGGGRRSDVGASKAKEGEDVDLG